MVSWVMGWSPVLGGGGDGGGSRGAGRGGFQKLCPRAIVLLGGAPRGPEVPLCPWLGVPWERGLGGGQVAGVLRLPGPCDLPPNFTSGGWAKKPELGKGRAALSPVTSPGPHLPDLLLLSAPPSRGGGDGLSWPLLPSASCSGTRRDGRAESGPRGQFPASSLT